MKYGDVVKDDEVSVIVKGKVTNADSRGFSVKSEEISTSVTFYYGEIDSFVKHAPKLKVGDKVDGLDELEALPDLAVIQMTSGTTKGYIYQKHGNLWAGGTFNTTYGSQDFFSYKKTKFEEDMKPIIIALPTGRLA